MIESIALLGAMPDRTPKHADVIRLANSLVCAGNGLGVIVDLSRFAEIISSEFVARLVALNKRVRAAKRRLILCGLAPLVRDAFVGAKLDMVFEICDDERAALARFQTISARSEANVKSSPANG